jgi:hypothetical protein
MQTQQYAWPRPQPQIPEVPGVLHKSAVTELAGDLSVIKLPAFSPFRHSTVVSHKTTLTTHVYR